MHFHLFFFGWRIMPVHHLPMIMSKVSNEQRKEKEVKRQDWKEKRRAHSQLLDQTFCSVDYCHQQWTGRKCKGTEFIKVRSSESACHAGDPGSILRLGRSPGEGNGYPLQYCDLENSLVLQRVRQYWATFTFTFKTKDHPADHGKLPKETGMTAWVTAFQLSDCLAWKGAPACLWAQRIMPPVTLLHKSWTFYKWAYQFYGITWDKLVKKLRDIYSKQSIWLLNNWPEAILLGNN